MKYNLLLKKYYEYYEKIYYYKITLFRLDIANKL